VDDWQNVAQSTLTAAKSSKSGGKSANPSTTSKTKTPTSAGRATMGPKPLGRQSTASSGSFSNSNSHLEGFPDVEDESQERAAISEGRRTQQVSFRSYSGMLLLLIDISQLPVKVSRSDAITKTKPRSVKPRAAKPDPDPEPGSNGGAVKDDDPNDDKKKRIFVVADLQPFYRESNKWVKDFLPAVIDEYGNSSDPWDIPGKDILTLLQDVRDRIYPDTDQVVDQAGPVWYLVCFFSLLICNDSH
jgi:hypothetical protein